MKNISVFLKIRIQLIDVENIEIFHYTEFITN